MRDFPISIYHDIGARFIPHVFSHNICTRVSLFSFLCVVSQIPTYDHATLLEPKNKSITFFDIFITTFAVRDDSVHYFDFLMTCWLVFHFIDITHFDIIIKFGLLIRRLELNGKAAAWFVPTSTILPNRISGGTIATKVRVVVIG